MSGTRAVALICAGGLLAACASAVAGSGTPGASRPTAIPTTATPTTATPTTAIPTTAIPTTATPTTLTPSGGFPTSGFPSTVVPTVLTTSPPRPASTAPLPSGTVTVTYDVPSGFTRTSDYHQLTPLETRFTERYFIPTGKPEGKDVLSFILYTIPGTTPRSDAAQRAKIAAYDRVRQASTIRALQATVVGRTSAYSEVNTEPGGYVYTAFYVFLNTSLLQVSCQFDKYAALINAGCAELVKSVKLT